MIRRHDRHVRGARARELISVISPSVSLRKLVTCTKPKSTAEAFARFVPVIVTVVPPAAGPVAGTMPALTEGRADAVT